MSMSTVLSTFSKKLLGFFMPHSHVRNHEMRGCGELTARALHLEMQRELVIGAVNFEDAMHVDLRWALRSEFAINTIGGERGFGIALAFENLLVHATVARVASACAAGDVDDDLARCLARIRIEMDGSALQLERPMDRVQHVVQRELDLGLGWIEIQRRTIAASEQTVRTSRRSSCAGVNRQQALEYHGFAANVRSTSGRRRGNRSSVSMSWAMNAGRRAMRRCAA